MTKELSEQHKINVSDGCKGRTQGRWKDHKRKTKEYKYKYKRVYVTFANTPENLKLWYFIRNYAACEEIAMTTAVIQLLAKHIKYEKERYNKV